MEIQSNVPMPPRTHKKDGVDIGLTAAMRTMNVGDSLVSRTATGPHVIARNIGIKVSVRRTENPYEWRVWRTA